MLSSISVPQSSLLETVRLHSTSLVLSLVSCKPQCPLWSLSVRNVGRARASAGAEDKWATTAQCARSYARPRQQDSLCCPRRAAPIAQTCIAARLPENQERRRGVDAA